MSVGGLLQADSMMSTLSPADVIPPELSVPLMSFVAVTGLDIVHNAVHKSIFSLLMSNRPSDRVPVHFRLLDGDHEYPRPKPKRQSYEWYVPKGLLRTNWMSKHLYLVPAVAVVFFDLDWDEAAWNEKLVELSAKVQVARTALEGRNTKVAVVLIQHNSPLPPGEDVAAAERATALCAACELPVKLLFVFPHTDHQFGYVIRLENAFYELAQAHYQQQAKVVKAHREFLNKTTHQLLYVRHQFKMAFYNELRHDLPLSLKHYKQAYMNLLEVRATDTNIAEVKMVAGFISYKICKLSFSRNVPLDAISQFRKHIDIFKGRTGPPELAFEHSAWMSKQFCAFGDLFEEAIEGGLSAIQTQHPGFYYQQAAVHAIARKKLCEQLCKDCHHPQSDPLSGMDNLEYYGQRPWRPGVQSLEPPDPRMERDGIVALQYKEVTEINHPMLIIPLLSNAIAQFKKYRCPRMKRYLVVEMGEQYFSARDYSKALALLSHVMWDYRSERWWSLLTDIITTAVKCAYAVANVQEYITLCLEIVGKNIDVGPADKERLQCNLIAATSNAIPLPEPGLDEADVKSAEELWRMACKSTDMEPLMFTVQMNHAPGFLRCNASFDETSFPVDGLVSLTVPIRVFCPLPIRFAKLSVIFSNQLYNKFCVVTDSQSSLSSSDEVVRQTEDLLCEPGVPKAFKFAFVAAASDVNQTIEIVSVVLQLGNESFHCALLHWKVSDTDGEHVTSQLDAAGVHRNVTTKIIARESLLRIRAEHASPALVDEFYSLNLSFGNDEVVDIEDAVFSVVLSEPSAHVNLFEERTNCGSSTINRLSLGPVIGVGQRLDKRILMQVTKEGSYTLLVKVEYGLTLAVNGDQLNFVCWASEEVAIPVVRPFSFTSRVISPKMDPMEAVWMDEMAILRVEIESVSPWPIRFHDSRFKLNSNDSEDCDSQIADVVLNSGDAACECRFLTIPAATEDSITDFSLGTFHVSWMRDSPSSSSTAEELVVQSVMTLPGVPVVRLPLSISLDLPAHGWVRTPLTVAYRVRNTMAHVQEFDFFMDSSDAFMFAGHKQAHFKILPKAELTLKYNLYPLVSGHVCIPRLRMVSHDVAFDVRVEGLLRDMLPTHVFIMPQVKSMAAVNEPKK